MLRLTASIGLIWLAIAGLVGCTQRLSPALELTAIAVSPAKPNSGQKANLTVFAAASLTDAFREIGQRFEAIRSDSRVTFNFAGSQQLALQIEQGANADIFASADQRNVDTLVAAELVDRHSPMTFAYNQLIVILPQDNPGQIYALKDLASPGSKLLFAGAQVPVGVYTRQVLDNLAADPAYGSGFKDAVLKNVVSNEENVKQVVAKILLGEADAGIVYRSDATPALVGKLGQIDISEPFNVHAIYPIVILDAAPDVELARQFVRFVLSPDGQQILEKWGFIPVADR